MQFYYDGRRQLQPRVRQRAVQGRVSPTPQIPWQASLLPKDDVEMDRRNLVRPGIGKLEPNPLTSDDRVLEPASRGREHGDDETRVKLRSG